MGRLSALRSSLLLPLFRQQQPHIIRSISYLIYPPNILPSSPSPCHLSSLTLPTAACFFSSFSPASRTFSSDSGADLPSNMVVVKSEDQLNESLRKAADESSPAIFYFTAVWCGPCRFLWPDIKKLSETLPDVKFYKIDIDEVRTGPTLSNLEIFSVPTLHFFKDGKKAAQVVGADARKIKEMTSALYKNDN